MCKYLVIFCLLCATTSAQDLVFIRGDTDASGLLSITDSVITLDFLFLGGGIPQCLDAADSDDSGELDLNDAIYTLFHLFFGDPPPPFPYPDCGPDPTFDTLECEEFRFCQ